MRFALALFAFGLLASSGSAIAEEPVIPKPLKVMPSKIKPVQSTDDELSKASPEPHNAVSGTDMKMLETMSPRPTGGFSADFWNGASRQDMVTFLRKASPVRSSPSVRKLELKAVLTPAPQLKDSTNPEENIYALRLKRLVELGNFEDAQKLYKMNESEPPTPLAAIAGIESSLGSNEIAVACLDQKTFGENLKTIGAAFWTNVDTFCQALLSPVAGDDDMLRLANASRAYIEITKASVTTAEEINKLDVITTIALSEIGGLSKILSEEANISKVDDKHLAVILAHSKPSFNGLPLIADGLTRGLMEHSEALAFMKAIDLKAADAKNTPADLKAISDFYSPFLKEYFNNPAAPALSDTLLNLADCPVKQALLYPLYSADNKVIPAAHKDLSVRLMLLTHQELPISLVNEAFPPKEPNGDESSSNSESGLQILIKYLQEKVAEKDDGTEKQVASYPAAALAALNYTNYPQKDAKYAYDNILNLTPNGNYVMPIGDILSSLKTSADKKQMNQVVIRSLAIIDDKPLDQLHPAALYRILEALNSAGLTEETMSLTQDALGTLMKKL